MHPFLSPRILLPRKYSLLLAGLLLWSLVPAQAGLCHYRPSYAPLRYHHPSSLYFNPYRTYSFGRIPYRPDKYYGSKTYPGSAYVMYPKKRSATVYRISSAPDRRTVQNPPQPTIPETPPGRAQPPTDPPRTDSNPNSIAARSEGWQQLAAGQFQEALQSFSSLTYQYKTSGLPKLGFGLAAALSGDDATAHFAFEQAFLYDPEGTLYAPIGPELRVQLVLLQDRYTKASKESPDNPQLHFNRAVISYFVRDYTSAEEALENAHSAGHKGFSLQFLQQLLPPVGMNSSNLDDQN